MEIHFELEPQISFCGCAVETSGGCVICLGSPLPSAMAAIVPRSSLSPAATSPGPEEPFWPGSGPHGVQPGGIITPEQPQLTGDWSHINAPATCLSSGRL